MGPRPHFFNVSVLFALCSLLCSLLFALLFALCSLLFALCSVLYKKMGPQPHFFVVELLYQSLFAVNDINSRFCNLVELAAGEVVNDFALCVLLYYLLYAGVVRLYAYNGPH